MNDLSKDRRKPTGIQHNRTRFLESLRDSSCQNEACDLNSIDSRWEMLQTVPYVALVPVELQHSPDVLVLGRWSGFNSKW